MAYRMKGVLGFLARAGFAAALVAAAWWAAGTLGSNAGSESMDSIERAVRQAAVSCYAAEGRYPDTLGYLEERYGVRLDPRYAVHYEVFAPNIAPDVTVVTKPSEEELWGLRH